MNRISFENYAIEDFVADESFINYHFRLNEKDIIFWETWVRERPEKQQLVREALQVIQSFSLTLPDNEYQSEYRRMKAVVEKKTPAILFQGMHRESATPERRIKRLIGYGLLGLCVIATSAIFLLKPTTETNTAVLTKVVTSGDVSLTISLSDSTVVTLAPQSTLTYPSSFYGTNREVSLSGEASFNVKHNDHLPFKVRTKNVVTTVLGTIFNIKKPGDSAIVVELLKGKVNVSIEDSSSRSLEPILLSPNEKAIYVFSNSHFYKRVGPAVYNVSFTHADFATIAIRIKNIAGKTVINNSNKRNWSVTGDFKDATPEEIIENICLTKKLHKRIVRDTIFITN